MGMFDDLIPEGQATTKAGLFDDLIPDAPPAAEPGVSARLGGFGRAASSIDSGIDVRAGQIADIEARLAHPRITEKERAFREQQLSDLRYGQSMLTNTEEPTRDPHPPIHDPFKDETFGELTERRSQEFAQGASGIIQSVARARGIDDRTLADAIQRDAPDRVKEAARQVEVFEGILERGVSDDGKSPMSKSERETYQSRLDQASEALQGWADVHEFGPAFVGDRAPGAERAAANLKDWTNETFGVPPQDDSFWSQLAYGGGSMVGFALPTIAAGPMGVPVTAQLGADAAKTEAYDRAKEFGASERDAQTAAALAGYLGTLEAVPIARALDRLPEPVRRDVLARIGRFVSRTAKGSFEEAVQEGFAEVGQNFIKQKIYDPEQKIITPEVGEQALVGAVLGGFLGGGSAALRGPAVDAVPPRAGPGAPRAPEPPKLPPLTAAEIASPVPSDVIQRGKARIEEIKAKRNAPTQPEAPRNIPEGAEPLSTLYDEAPAAQGARTRPVEVPERDTAPAAVQDAPSRPEAATEAPESPDAPEGFEDIPEIDADGNETGRMVRLDLETGKARIVPPEAESPARPEVDETPAEKPAPASSEVVDAAAAQAAPEPTDAQKEAGNFQKGHTRWNGLDISIENAKGSTRRGTDPDGNEWSVEMPAHYGYVRRTEGADGDQVDVYVGENPDSDRVFVVDQVDAETGAWDEHKAMIGFDGAEAAQAAHAAAFSDGKGEARRGGLTEMSAAEFKDWAQNGDTTKPLSADATAPPAGPRTPAPQKRPVANELKSRGLRIDPQSPVADELRARGINARTHPGLFKGGGVKDLDNLPASEWAEYAQLLGTDDNGYLSRQGIIDALESEMRGAPVQNAEQSERQAAADAEIERARERFTPEQVEETARAEESAGGFYVPPPGFDTFGSPAERRAAASDYISRSLDNLGMDGLIDRADTDWATEALDRDGGSVDNVVWEAIRRSLQRDRQADAAAPEDIPFSDPVAGEGRQGTPRDRQADADVEQDDAGTEGQGEARPAGTRQDRGGEPAAVTTERTEAGEQTVIPGAEQSEGRSKKAREADQRREVETRAKQSKKGTTKPQEGAGPLFGDEGGTQGDMFAAGASDTSPTPAKPKRKSPKAEARERAEAIADYFTPGNIVRSYGGAYDRVLAFEPDTSDTNMSVTVESVVKRDGEWVKNPNDTRVRTHSTRPEPRELRQGPVERAAPQESPVQEPTPKETSPTTKKPAKSKPDQEAKAARIEDFGEKIEGAQKDKAKGWLARAAEVSGDEIADVPLSKSWPEPDYQGLLDEGANPFAVAFIHAARDEIPNKPRQAWKVKRWAEQVRLLRDFATGLVDGRYSESEVKKNAAGKGLKGFMGRVDLYQRFGHDKSLKGVSMAEQQFSLFMGERYDKPKNKWVVTVGRRMTAWGDTKDQAMDAFAEHHEKMGGGSKRNDGVTFEIRRYRGDAIFIGKKIGKNWIEVAKDPEWDWAAARKYLAENQEALEAEYARKKALPPERGEDNSPRVGEDYRNSQDVTPEMFSEAFGFRGVQFGNYVEGSRRQQDLNEAYDGFMDLAAIIGVPPKALSLNGSLGLAFGARGSGRKASAHYEPGQIVINLTKGSGAGSLAHEWWHGMDHYFARQGGRSATLLTENPRGLGDGIRPEVVQAFKGVIDAIRNSDMIKRARVADMRKSKPYFATMVEVTARGFESYVIGKLQDQSQSNDYLANILSEDAWTAIENMAGQTAPSWPYVRASELPEFREAFDGLFDTIETEQTPEGTVRMYQREDDTFAAQVMTELAANDDLFAYEKSGATSIGDMFEGVVPDAIYVGEIGPQDVTADDNQAERHLFRLKGSDGKETDFFVHLTEGEVWFDVSQLKEGQGGSRLYSAVADFALNTDRTFIGDPAGLSDIALRRRTDAMLSSALKHGTTEHLAPHPDQVAGNAEIGVPPLDWTGNDLEKLQSLIKVSVDSLAHHVPEIRRARYDFQTRTFRTSQGKPFSDGMLGAWAAHRRLREARAGRRSIKRAVLLNSLLQTESGARPGLLEQIFQQHAQLVRDGLSSTFYRRQPDPDKIEAVSADLDKRLKKLMIRGVDLRADPEMAEQGALEIDRDGQMAILIGASMNKMATVNHEAIHILRARGLFSDKEWGALETEAKAIWMAKYDIRSRYRDIDEAGQIEEAIAEAFAEYADKKAPTTRVQAAFAKIKRFFRALKESLTAQGITRPEDIFLDVETGAVGARPERAVERMNRRDQRRAINTNTPEFKKWFGDSAVVDENGEPLVVHHGTTADFEAFEMRDGNSMRGAYFSSDRDGAEEWGQRFGGGNVRTVSAYISLKRPATEEDVVAVIDRFVERGRGVPTPEQVTNALKRDGFDGYMDQSSSEDALEIVAFHPKQIKSADNRGTFDPADPRILYQRPTSKVRQRSPQGQQALAASTHSTTIPDRAAWDALAARNLSVLDRAAGLRGGVSDSFDKFRIKVQDRMLPLLRAEEAVEKLTGGKVDERDSPYRAEERYTSKVGAKLDRIDDQYTKPIIGLIAGAKTPIKIKDQNGQERTGAEAASLWLMARHAKERNAHIASINDQMPDGGSGLTNAQADAILNQAGTHQQRLDSIGALTDQLGQDMIDLREQSGLLSPQEALAWRRMYKHYVPLRRFAENDMYDAIVNEGGTNMGRRYNIRGSESRQALGRSTEAFDPLATLLTQAQEVAIRAEKNVVAQTLHNFVSNNPNPAMWEISTPETQRYFNKDTGKVETRVVGANARQLSENEMALKIKGKEHRITLNDPRIARAMGQIGTNELNGAIKFAGKFSQLFSAVNTMLSPPFVIVNGVRDMITAQVNLGESGGDIRGKLRTKAITSWVKAARGAHRGMRGLSDTEYSKWFREYEEAGGKVHFWFIEDPEGMSTDFKKRVKREARGKILGTASKLVLPSTRDNPALAWIERINLTVDNAVRLATYVEARKNGWSKEKAAKLSKNLTVNFNRRGESTGWMNALYPFMNAAIQGSQVMLKAMTARQVQGVVGGMFLFGLANDLLNAALSAEDDDGELEYDQLPNYVSERNIILATPGSEKTFATVPLPYGYNFFFYAGQQMGKIVRGVKKPGEASGQTLKVLIEGFAPVGGDTLFQALSPMLGDFAFELATNEDWLGRPIRPENPYGDYGPQSYKEYNASTPSRAIARGMNSLTGGTPIEPGLIDISPEYIDHIAKHFTGGMGRFAGQAYSLGERAAQGTLGDTEAYQIPLVRVLRTESGDFMNQTRYFEFRQAVQESRAQKKLSEATGEPMTGDMKTLNALWPKLQAAEKRRKDLGDKMDAIYADDRLSNAQREAKLKPLRDLRNRAYLDFNRSFIGAMGPQAE